MGADSSLPLRGRSLIFQLAERTYAIPTAAVEEIVPMAELTRAPGAPSFLSGFLDIAGQLVAVISLRRLFSLPDQKSELYTPLVVLKSKTHRIAIEVDGVTRVADIGDNDLISLNESSSLNDCATAIAHLDGTTVVLLSPDRILMAQELKRVAELAELARERISAMEVVSV